MPNEEQLLGYLKRVTGELHQTRQRLREAESEERDPIAIVGMACRYPGGVSSPEDLWGLVAEGTDAIGDFPDDRGWDTGALYDADPDRPGTSYVRQGGFLTGAGEFDAGLFGISPREALAMDPQQRLMLELAWEAFERAGLAPDSLEGRSVGVFVGSGGQDYFDDLSADAMGEAVERYLSTGNAAAVLSGRVSYTFGLQGPAVTIDTACSSSLVALHTAVRSLRQKECSLALAGGVMVMSTPSPFVAFSRQRGLAADGRCKSFSDGADGTGWSEGAGVLLVERLSDARRLRHPVLAVVRGSAVNQDGASNGMTAPNGPAQQRVIRQALADAGLRAADVDVVEGHGTGTTLGDPIEAQALLATYGQDRGEGAGRPLWLGSVKSNLGHTQAAAGVAGVIKMVMAMRQGVLPRTLHVDAPSGQVDWSAGRVELLTESAPWPVGDRPRRAGVSSFGVSGTNAHVILEQAEDEDDDTYLDGEDRPTESASVPPSGTTPVPLPVSGRDATALSAQAAGLIKHLTNGSQHDLTDVGYALGTTRAALEHRAVVLAPDLATAERGLTAVSLTHDDPAVVRGVVGEGLTGFVFSGQGSGWWGVGRELYGVFPVFAAAFDAVCVELDPLVGGSLREVLWSPDAPEAAGSMWVQAGLFAVQVGLFRLWESWGVVPDVVAGHSVGELAAAHCAGVWSLADACRVVAARGRLMDGLPTGGVMAAVAVSETDIEPWLSDGGVSLAAVNGPSSVVVSGARPDVEPVVAHFEARGVSVRWLEVAHGFHSALMEPMLAEFRAVLDQITFSTTQLGAVSTVTGGSAVGEWSSPDYWVRQVREPVRFADAVQELEAQGVGRFVELGPGSVLSGLVSGCVQNPGSTVVASLRGGRGEVESVTLAAARLHVVGQRLDWEGFFTGREGRARRPRRVELPTYAFQRQRYWLDRRNGLDNPSSLGLDSAGHPFLGAFTVVADSGVTVLTGRLSTESLPWLADHTVHGDILLPGTAFVELAIRAGDQVACEGLEELALHAPLVLTEGGAVRIQVVVGAPEEAGARTVGIYAYDERDSHEPVWTLHADGVLVPKGRIADFELGSWPPADAEPVGLDGLTDALAAAGLAYGAAFQGLRAVWRRDEEIFAEVRLPSDGAHPHEAERFALHPAVLDAGTQALQTVDGGAEQDAETGTVRLPFSWSGVSVYATGADSLRMRFTPRGQDTFSIAIADVAGAPVASVDSVTFRPAAATSPAQAGAEESVYRLKWVPSTSTPALTPASIPASSSASLTPPRTAPPTTAEYDELSAAATVPELVLLRSAEPADGPGTAEEVGAAVHRVLEAIQHWLDDERFTSSTLAVCTRDAAPVGGSGTAADLAAAAVWGLVRSAQAEHPGRFVLVDVDSSDDPQALPRAAAAVVATGEPQGAVRDGLVYAPRLAHGPGAEETDVPTRQPADFDTHGTVLLTGASGAVGGAVARHLVTRHDVRHLVLPGRRGAEAPGLAGLVKELADLGAEITTPVCDVGDRQAVADLLAGIPAERPLTAVLHAAGVLDDGVVTEMTPERIDAVLRPKVYGALNLHDLTRDHDLTHFVLFSSVSGLFGAPGQSNYAAANTFLDGLAELRRAQGLPGQSMAWGPWSTEGGMTAGLDDGARTRIRRSGVLPTSVRTGLALFDAALASPVATVVPISVDAEALRTRPGTLPVAFRGLAAGDRKPSSRRKAATLSSGTGAVDSDGDGGGGVEPGTLAARLADLAQEERAQTLEDLVRSEVASVLGHGSAAAVDPQREFHQLGFDSLMAVELRNTLSAATAMRLPATLVFDYPTVTSLADHLLAELIGTPDPLDRPATPATPKKTDEDPIAIVGMACRYPGGVSSPEDLWRLVAEGTDAIGDFPDDRGWDLDRLHDPKAERPDTSYVREGGFLLDAGDFDAGFFGIPPREAATVDPQQRLLLETSWEALERAGIDPLSLKGSSTGVFAGIQYHDYAGSASTGSIASGRIAYTLGLEGPAISVDTACSSSLVAMHWASRSLRAGECSLALAGGVTVMATPETFVEFSRQNGLSKDARCKAYSGTADGTAWSEGVGMVVLERLSDARRLGHPVLAVVRGSAVNQDGASNGMTAPNGPAQQRVIRQALADARVSGDQVDVVEGHGTGTTLGDPIEAQALLATYGQDRSGGHPLWLGSVKSNLGHTQAAAGVAGVIKMVMAMRQGVLPRTLHVDEPTPHVDWSAGRVELLTESVPWPVGDRPRRAGVSSFGVSGTNAHLVLEQPLDAEQAEERTPRGTDDAATTAPLPWFVSARNREALRTQAERLLTYVDDAPDLDTVDIAHSTVSSRGSMEHRAVVIARNRGEHLMGLLALVDGEESRGVVRGVVDGGLKSGFVFSGQGSGWWGVGRELYEVFPAFAAAFDAVCVELDPLVGGSLREVLWSPDAPEPGVAGSMWVQAGLFAVQVGLFRLWESWGVVPDVVAGHSVGELAAAHVAGVWSLADACRVVAARGRLMDGLPTGGVMAAVAVSEEEIEPWLSDGGVSLAAVNGPSSVVVSGARPDVEPVVAHFQAQGVSVRWLEVAHGFHSVLMEPMLADFRAVLDQVAFAEPLLGAVSTVTGGSAAGEWSSPDYWLRQVREPVRFADAVKELEARGVGRFVELGPGSVLSGLVSDCVQNPATATVVASLRGGRGEVESVTAAAARLHVVGQRVDWEAFFTGGGHRRGSRVELPTYAFQRQRYWLQKSSGGDAGSLGLGVVEHPLLSAVVESPESGGVVLTGRLSVASQPWLADHRVHGSVVVPGTALVELAIRAGDQVGCGHLEELTLEGPLVLPETGAVAVQVAVGSADASGSRPVSVYSRATDAETQVSWVRHAQGAVRTVKADSPTEGTDLSVWPPKKAQRVELEGLYEELAEGGFAYGPAFRGLREVWRRGGEVFAEVTLPEGVAGGVEGFGLHPAVLDAALHAVGAGGVSDLGGVPFAWSGVELWAAGASSVRVRVAPVGGSGAVSLELADGAGVPVASVESLVVRPVSAEQISAAAGSGGASDGELFRVEWPVATTAAGGVAADGGWVVLGEDHWATGDEARRCANLTSLGELVSSGVAVPDVVVAPMFDMALAEGPVTAAGVRAGVGRVLEMAQAWLSDERYASSRLVVVTRNAVDTGSGAAVDVAGAAVWGLIRSALAEHPGRFGLLDMDEADCPVETLRAQVFSGEDEAAIRRGKVRVPRLARSTPSLGTDTNGTIEGRSWDPEGMVLITGGLGGLGRAVARHLVTEHGVRHLLLVSRSGTRAEGAHETAEQLTALGAEVRIAACDVADRDATRALLQTIPAEHPLTAVIHAAGVVDDGVVTSLTAERLERVLRPKVDAAWNLHELTVELGLEPGAFVLFSSAAGVLGAPGQAGYAAGNTFLDGLAAYRRSSGLAGQSLAWGLWSAEQGGMAAGLSAEDHSRLSRDGIVPLSTADGLALLDTASTVPDPLLLPLHLDLQALGRAAEELPSLFRGLIRPPVIRRSSTAAEPGGRAGLLERLLGLSSQEREAELLDLLRTEAAVLLGHPGREAIEPGRSFNDLGFDSLSAVGFRNKLNLLTGMKLPATLIFDYPTSHDLARHLAAELGPDSDDAANTEDAEARVREILQTIPLARLRDAGLLDSLYELAGHEDEYTAPDTSGEDAIDAMDTDKLISLALQDAGNDDATGEE